MSIEGVKVGDMLAIRGNFNRDIMISEVIRITKLYAVTATGNEHCPEDRWKLSDGTRPGSDSFHRQRAKVATEADLLEYRVQMAQWALNKFKVTAENVKEVEVLLATKRTESPAATS